MSERDTAPNAQAMVKVPVYWEFTASHSCWIEPPWVKASVVAFAVVLPTVTSTVSLAKQPRSLQLLVSAVKVPVLHVIE